MSSATPFDIDHPKSMLEEILGYSLHPNIIYGRFSRSIRLHLGNLSGSFQIIDNVMLVFFFYLTGLVKERWPERGVKDIINSLKLVFFFYLTGLVKERWPERGVKDIINSLNSRLKEIRQQDALKE